MEPLSREYIIELINQYIYTNGNQLITAAQLREILLDIANAFAMEGSAAGIDDVLAAGSNVSAGRKITNSQGGAVNLAGTVNMEGATYNYLGFDMSSTTLSGTSYTGLGQSLIGNAKRNSPSRTLMEMVFDEELEKGELFSAIGFIATGVEEEDKPKDGLYLMVGNENGKNGVSIRKDEVSVEMPGFRGNGGSGLWVRNGQVHAEVKNDDDNYVFTKHNLNNIESEVANSSSSSSTYHIQRYNRYETKISAPSNEFKKVLGGKGEVWYNDDESIFSVEANGVNISEGKKLGLSTSGDAPTAGLATLSSGTASVATAAVGSESVISLTVQHTGAFTGNIRVADKTPGTGFKITSTQDTDSCTVFWQIIELG